ncbi:hypothetical protein ES702_03709 [subsurface metagenome]
MDKKKLLEMQVKDFNRKVLTTSEKDPGLNVNPATRTMYIAYVKKMKTLFPENEEVKNLSEEIDFPFIYADLSNLIGQLIALLNFLLKE